MSLLRAAASVVAMLALICGGWAAASGPGRVDLVLKLATPALQRLHGCAEIIAWWAAAQPQQPIDCTALRGTDDTYRLGWTGVASPPLREWLVSQRSAEVLAWFEFHESRLTLQAALQADDLNFFSTLLAAPRSLGDPAFVDDTALRLRNLLRIYPPRTPLVVAIIDSGVNFESARLRNLRWKHPGETAGNGIDDDGNGYVDDNNGWDFVEDGHSDLFDDTMTPDRDPQDLLGHGTVVAAIVAATVGEEASEMLRLMPLRVASGTNGSGTVSPFALAEAIRYATSNGARVINLSVGSTDSYLVVREAVEAALAQGVLVVAAAGNTGAATLFPANIPGVLAVGALDAAGQTWPGSAHDSTVGVYLRGVAMLGGLGVDVRSLGADGTSYATASASGRQAMLLAIVGSSLNPACASAAGFLQLWQPPSRTGDSWIAAAINRVESSLGDENARIQAWSETGTWCSAQITVASLLRSAQSIAAP